MAVGMVKNASNQKNGPQCANQEYNKVEGLGFSKSSEKNTELFMNHLDSKRVNVGLRRSRGKDINAACGQLANKK